MSGERKDEHEPHDVDAAQRWKHLPERVDPADWVETTDVDPEIEAPVVLGDGVTYPSGTTLHG